jgi:FtsZ-interacting cell division protein ZipA
VDTGIIILIVVAVVLLLVGGLVAARLGAGKRRSKQLRDRFGPEYDRAVDQHGGRKEAEEKLTERQERREGLDIRSLEPDKQQRFAVEWRRVQGRFVDAPQEAVRESDHLVKEVMRQRGYPIEDFERRADDISVDHPHVVENYRSAGQIAERNERGETSTEELRQALVHYRALFEELLGEGGGGAPAGGGARHERAGGREGDAGAGGHREGVR